MNVTKEMLERKIERLNEISGSDYCLDWSNGGVKIEITEGRVCDIAPRSTKHEAEVILSAMIATIQNFTKIWFSARK